jgi:hypothetical protein
MTETSAQPNAYAPEDLTAVKEQVQQAPPVGVAPDPADLMSKLSGASPFEVDVEAMVKAMVAAEVKRIMAQHAGAEGEHNLIGTMAQARALIATHFEFHPKKDELLRLADDTLDAAKNAVESGDTGTVRQVASKLERRLNFFHPGPGDHHYFRQALSLVSSSLPDAADTVTEAKPDYSKPAVGSSQAPVKVLQGSVTG